MMKTFLLALTLCAAPVQGYTAGDKAEVKAWVEGLGFPYLDAFQMMTPKLAKTMLSNYQTTLQPGALDFLEPADVETIYAAVSALNNCEICLSFHAMAMLKAGVSQEDVDATVAGGIPKDEKLAGLVIASKYAFAHKGILLPREKKHLEELGFGKEKMMEVVYCVGQMTAANFMNVHLVSEGIAIEDFLQDVGPFRSTVYKKKEEL